MKTNIRFKGLLLLPVAAIAFLGAATQFSDASAAVESSWGPRDRQTFTWNQPASYPTFNSITDNPTIGDERNFVRMKEYGTEDKYTNDITIEAGKEYEVLAYFHNNASASLNADGTGLATGVYMQVEYPDYVQAGHTGVMTAKIYAENTNPGMVWDTALMNSSEAVYINYVPNSAFLHNNGSADGSQINGEALRGDGVALAYWNDLWGIVPGCNEYAGYITYRIKVDKPGFEMKKQVALSEMPDNFKDEIVALPGDILNFKIYYKNTGTTEQDTVVARDILPNGLTYLPNTTYTMTTRNPEKAIAPDVLFDEGGGLGLGAMIPGEEATVEYQAKIEDNKDLFPCGDTEIKNLATLYTHDGSGSSSTKIVVRRVCEDTPSSSSTTPSELPNTGPGEIVMAVLIVLTIGGGGFYLYRSQKMLRKVSAGVGGVQQKSGKDIVLEGIKNNTKTDKE